MTNKEELLPFCACGKCGLRVTKKGNKWIKGHHLRGKHHTDATKQILRDANLGKHLTNDHKLAISEGTTKALENPIIRNKISKAGKKRYEDPKERKRTSEAGKKRYEDPEERKLTSDAGKKWHKEHPGIWKGENNPLLGIPRTDAVKLAISKTNSDPDQLVWHHYAYDFGRPEALRVRITRKFHGQIHSPKGQGVHQRGYSLID